MEECSTVVGMDVHGDTIDVALADEGGARELRHYGRIVSDLAPVDRLIAHLGKESRRLRFIYEAGPCGFVLYRHLQGHGLDCTVVSPSMVPRRPGDRVKTDRRDALMLARLHRAGELRPIHVPTPDDEAMRDLVRAREDAVHGCRRARQRLKSLLLRHGVRYPGRADWSERHRRWLADRSLRHPAQQIAFQEYIETVNEAQARIDRLTAALRQLVPTWARAPVVDALQALKGVSFVVAVTLTAEVGPFARFDTPKPLMAFLGLVPSERSSGKTRRLGAITKAGNAHVRRILAQAAWAYRLRPAVSRRIEVRQQPLPPWVRTLAWKAQLRLCGRFRVLAARRKPTPKIATAVARELVGFIWDIARRVEPRNA